MLTCTDAHALIVRTIDDERLSGEARAMLRLHLASCAPCRDEYETQHEVRRLLALQVDSPLPAGFTARLDARLAEVSRHRLLPRESEAPVSSALFAWSAGEPVRHEGEGLRWRTWTLRLMPIAATLTLMVAGPSLRFVAPPPAAPSARPSDARIEGGTAAAGTAAGTERRFDFGTGLGTAGMRSGAPSDAASGATRGAGSGDMVAIASPRHDAAPPRLPTTPLATDVFLHAQPQLLPRSRPSHRSQVLQPVQASASAGFPNAPIVEPGAAVADAATSRTTIAGAPAPPPNRLDTRAPVLAPELADELNLSDTQRRQIDAAIERVLTPEQRRQYRERHTNGDRNANRDWNTSRERDASRERHASEGTSILPRPSAPFSSPSSILPTMPPATVSPDRTIPPY